MKQGISSICTIADLLATSVFDYFMRTPTATAPPGWTCTDFPPEPGETPAGGVLLKQSCENATCASPASATSTRPPAIPCMSTGPSTPRGSSKAGRDSSCWIRGTCRRKGMIRGRADLRGRANIERTTTLDRTMPVFRPLNAVGPLNADLSPVRSSASPAELFLRRVVSDVSPYGHGDQLRSRESMR